MQGDRIPKLAELIGDGARGEGWDELERATRQYLTYHPIGDGAVLTHFLRLFCVAAVEGARQADATGAEFPDVVSAMCKAAGMAVATAAGSACDDESAHRLAELKPILAGLVADGINYLIDYQTVGPTPSPSDGEADNG